MNKIAQLIEDSKSLLVKIIEIPSFSREEEGTAECIASFLSERGVKIGRVGNNVYALNRFFDADKETILLNSHHDTVKPNSNYSKDPFRAIIEENKLYGLGSNDAGGCLVSLIATFLFYFDNPQMKYNLCLLASAEEEISGKGGVEDALKHIPVCSFAIVGEPTSLELAVAEKGLMVLDCVSYGVSGHAARDEGVNAIYQAIEDVNWFRTFEFPKVSSFLGKVKMSVTMIEGGIQHNVIPSTCSFVVDVRTTELYSNNEVLDFIKKTVKSEVTARSTRLNSSKIEIDHPIVRSGLSLGKSIYGSPTMSDQALIPFPSIKVGPGDSARSHTADEFIYLHEIDDGVHFYINLLNNVII